MTNIGRTEVPIKSETYFTIEVCGMGVVGVETNGYGVTGDKVLDQAKVSSIRVSLDKGIRQKFNTIEGVRKVLYALEPSVPVKVEEHLVETKRFTTSVIRMDSERQTEALRETLEGK